MSLFGSPASNTDSPPVGSPQNVLLPQSLQESSQPLQTPVRPKSVRSLFGSPPSSPVSSPVQKGEVPLDVLQTPSVDNLWEADRKIRILMDTLTQGEKDILCSGVEFCLFYSNPQTQRGPMLNLNHELYGILGSKDMLQNKFLLTPVTTIQNFKGRLETYTPPVICFTGHADENGLAFHSDPGTSIVVVSMNEFIDIIAEIYKKEKKGPEFLLMFACKTGTIIEAVNSNSEYKRIFKNTIIVGWETFVENMAASTVSLSILKKVYDYLRTPKSDKKAFVKTLLNIPDLKWGDPEEDLIKTDEHYCMYNAILHCNLIHHNVKTLAQLRNKIDPNILNYGRMINKYSVLGGNVYKKEDDEDITSITIHDTHVKCGKYLIVKDPSFTVPEGYEPVHAISGNGKDGFCAHCMPVAIGTPFYSFSEKGEHVKFTRP